jgi:hypothetical protein
MEQVYWLSPPTERGSDTRMLLYRYGNFAYAGSVLTEPVRGLEYLPGVLTGIQAVQGQVPYLCECSALPPDSPYTASLLALQRALDLVHGELDAHTERLAALAAQPGNEWIDAEGGALYFEIETVPGYTCNVRVGQEGGARAALPLSLSHRPDRRPPSHTLHALPRRPAPLHAHRTRR